MFGQANHCGPLCLNLMARDRNLFRNIPNLDLNNIKTMKQEVNAWKEHRNNKKAVINWQFTNKETRVKLKRLYPTIIS